MLISDLDDLECILEQIKADDEPRYIDSKYETEFIETCLTLMYDYINDNPSAISDSDFEEDIIDDVRELFFIHFEDDVFFNDIAEEQFEEIIEIALSLFYDYFIPMRSQDTSSYESKLIKNKSKQLEDKIRELSERPQPEQRSKEWYSFRHNLITASNAYKAFENQCTQNQLIYEKCQPLNIPQESSDITSNIITNTNSTLHWGQKYEPISVMIYEDNYKTKIGDFGCIQHSQYTFLGASPDGINIDKNNSRYGRMLEIKNIVNRDINGIPKKEYWIQMQLQMETCDLNECDFLETKFIEYTDSEAYNEDTDLDTNLDNDLVNITLSKDHFKKGSIIYFHTKEGKPFYLYKPLNLIYENDINKWEEEMINLYESNNYTFVRFIYWKLEEISCVLVLRNKKWFQDNIETLQNIWSLIEKERKEGFIHRAPNKRAKKEPVVQPNEVTKPILNVIKIRTESFDETKSIMK
jgi:putative phage-type endonuclease